MCRASGEPLCERTRERGVLFPQLTLVAPLSPEESGLWMASVPVPHPAASVCDLVVVTVSGLLLLSVSSCGMFSVQNCHNLFSLCLVSAQCNEFFPCFY